MQNDIIAKIDALVKMSESSSNAATLRVELRELECAIKEKRFELKELKSSITDDKYFDATGEIVDKNIEISLTKKIKSLNKSLTEVESKIEDTSEEEAKKFAEVEDLKHTIDSSKKFADVLNTKISSENTKEKASFKKLLKETENKLKEAESEVSKTSKNYEKVQGKLEVLIFSKKELEKKLEEETEKLIDIKANLLNRRCYFNSELKKEDEERIKLLETEIKKLEDSKSSILYDPIMIAEDAKNYLIDDDKTSALKKVKELKNIVLAQPYMDLDSNTSKEDLVIELENVEAKRDEFASMISSKNYESVDTTLLKDRIDYIEDKKKKVLKEIEQIREKIKQSDTKELEDLNNRINYCEVEVKNLKNKISEYEEILESEDLSINRKAILQASFDKKQEEFNNVLDLLNLYKKDRENLILASYELENTEIKRLENIIDEIDKEKKRLEKLCASSNKAKDIIAIENDKKALKELNDNIKAIKKRKALKVTPSELYDEIELLLGMEIDNNYSDSENYDDSIYEYEVESNETNNFDELNEESLVSLDIPESLSTVDTDIKDSIEDFTIDSISEFDSHEDKTIDDNTTNAINDLDVSTKVDLINEEPVELTSLESFNIEDMKEDNDDEIDSFGIDNIDVEPLESVDLPNDLDFSEIEQPQEEVIDLNDSVINDIPLVDDSMLDINVTDINNDEEKIKVINVEPLDNASVEDFETDENGTSEFLIGDYKSEDVL